MQAELHLLKGSSQTARSSLIANFFGLSLKGGLLDTSCIHREPMMGVLDIRPHGLMIGSRTFYTRRVPLMSKEAWSVIHEFA